MAGKADLINSIVDSVDGAEVTGSPDDAAYASLDASVTAGETVDRGGWVADG
jgi:hypothetical protein